MIQNLKVTFIGGNNARSEGEAVYTSWSKSERFRKAFKSLLFLWLLSAMSIILPGLHFLLVPGLFLGGFLSFYLTYRRESRIVRLSGTCPVCGKAIAVKDLAPNWPLSLQCKSCNSNSMVDESERAGMITSWSASG